MLAKKGGGGGSVARGEFELALLETLPGEGGGDRERKDESKKGHNHIARNSRQLWLAPFLGEKRGN